MSATKKDRLLKRIAALQRAADRLAHRAHSIKDGSQDLTLDVAVTPSGTPVFRIVQRDPRAATKEAA